MIDLSMIDYPERKYRFEIFYLLLSLKYNTRFVVTTFTKEGTYLDSVTNIYPIRRRQYEGIAFAYFRSKRPYRIVEFPWTKSKYKNYSYTVHQYNFFLEFSHSCFLIAFQAK